MWAIHFIIAYALLLVVPGPSVLAIASQAVLHGKRAMLPYSIGIALGATVLFCAAAFGRGLVGPVGELSRFSAVALLFVAWRVGRAGLREMSGAVAQPQVSAGFLVAVTNPVTLAFFVAQVVSVRAFDAVEGGMLAAIVPAMAMGNACLMAFLFSRPFVRERLLRHRRVFALGSASCLALLAVKIALPL